MASFTHGRDRTKYGRQERRSAAGSPFRSWGWYDGVLKVFSAPPSNFTAVTGWGSGLSGGGRGPLLRIRTAKVEVANSKTYVHLKPVNGSCWRIRRKSKCPALISSMTFLEKR